MRNQQGDITKIVDKDGTIIVEYQYDAWGNIISKVDNSGFNLSVINAYTYRGYRYDAEINQYYLNSRYYNPEIGRFISSDAYFGESSTVHDFNLYAYVNNNPIMLSDPSGCWPQLSKIFTVVAIVAVIVVAVVVAVAAAPAIVAIASSIAAGTGGGAAILAGGAAFSWTALAPAITPAFIAVSSYFIGQSVSLIEEAVEEKSNTRDCPKPGSYPGDFEDPTKSPGEEWEWKGNGEVGSNKGSWYNKGTGESWHPDYNHEGGVPRHWDYSRKGYDGKWRVWEDGSST